MVKQGNLTVELVDAVTKEPFREHTYNGKIYVEVEPEAEYFIQITNQSKETIYWSFYVDGEGLGHWSYQKRGESDVQGIWSHHDWKESYTALKVARVRAQHPISNTLEN
eukprot:759333-Ditylum_brightwellii.AAC.1